MNQVAIRLHLSPDYSRELLYSRQGDERLLNSSFGTWGVGEPLTLYTGKHYVGKCLEHSSSTKLEVFMEVKLCVTIFWM
jgi:hypothetical protein